ncbi:hypothetical protein D9615_010129 [Tricholomella constricta]|uniref:Uncharacterized protein n=1 Tax=Tricholomella constricta TaxID=117010 RepID=A0A8H5LWM1_9AGAR|nr:hypothetical protein D9615_010129 [Tricholomella constricta]
MSGYKANNFVTHHLSDSVVHTLRWWFDKLNNPSGSRHLLPITKIAQVDVFVDASTSWGLGIIIGDYWHALKLVENWKQPNHDICWLEAVAVELAISFLAQLGFSNTHVLIHSDNFGAIGAHHKHRSPNLPINLCTRRTYTILIQHLIVPSFPTRSRVECRVPQDLIFRAFLTCRANSSPSSMPDHAPRPASYEAVDVGFGVFAMRKLPPRIPMLEKTTPSPSTLPSPPTPPFTNLESMPHPPRTTSITLAPGVSVMPSSPRRLAADALPHRSAKPPSSANTYQPSPYRPLVPADQRLLLWTAPQSTVAQNDINSQIPADFQPLLYTRFLDSLSDSTRQSYGAGLLHFTQFCDRLRIPEDQRMPASDLLISAFIADASGSHSGNCIRNWLNGLRSWHILNRAPWHGQDPWVLPYRQTADKLALLPLNIFSPSVKISI